MLGSIAYPSYPKDFKKKSFLNRFHSEDREVNLYIMKGVRDIILGIELGNIIDQAEHSYSFDEKLVKVTYNNNKFHAFVTHNKTIYDAPIFTEIEFQPITGQNNVYHAIKDKLEVEYNNKLVVKESEIVKRYAQLWISSVVFFALFTCMLITVL